jgi:hypothetical protein
MPCKTQVDAMAANAEMTLSSTEGVALSVHQYQLTMRRPFGLLEWPAMLRYLDRRDRGRYE